MAYVETGGGESGEGRDEVGTDVLDLVCDNTHGRRAL